MANDTTIGWIYTAIKSFDIDLLTYICYYYFIYGSAVFCILSTGITAPYGRYVNSSLASGTTTLNANKAWFIMELPALAVPVVLLAFGDCPKLETLPNKIFLACFLVHYMHR